MARRRIDKQLEKSTTAGSMTRTNVSNEQEYFAPGSSGQLLTIVAGVPTWQTITFPSEFEQYASHAVRPTTGATDIIYYSTAENDFSIWTGSAYVTVPTSPSITVAGNSGANQTIASGATLSILASLGFTSVASATGNVTITPPSGTTSGDVLTWNGTAWASATSGTFTVAGDTGTSQIISHGDTLTIKGATSSGVLVTASATDTLSISLREVKESFSPLTSATTVTLSQTPIVATLDIYRNGDLQELTTDYTVSGVTVTFVVAFGASVGATYSEQIIAKYRY
jgi:hypothetical protein